MLKRDGVVERVAAVGSCLQRLGRHRRLGGPRPSGWPTVNRYWSRHTFTSSVVAGVLVLLLTVLIVNRVARIRQLRNQSRAIGAQSAVILAQAVRTRRPHER